MTVHLKKGTQIDLAQSNVNRQVCVGVNWGVIRKKALFGLFEYDEEVDLDCNAAIYDQDKQLIEVIDFRNLRSKDGAMVHSGDDLTGDRHGDDGIDNEVITIDFDKMTPQAQCIVFFLNNYKKQNFADIPYSKVRIFQGTSKNVNQVFAEFNLSSDRSFSGYISMIMGKFCRNKNQEWSFHAIGVPTKTWRILDTLNLIQQTYIE